MLRTGAVKVAQRVARGVEVAVLERDLGAAHQARRLECVSRAVGALEPSVAPLEVAHLVSCARREQSRHPGGRAVLESDTRLFLGPRIASFVISLQRGGKRGLRPLAPAARTPGAHGDGQRERAAERAE
jgi:hypothetical protein